MAIDKLCGNLYLVLSALLIFSQFFCTKLVWRNVLTCIQNRDWLYVEDHTYGIDLVLHNGRISEKYNIGGDNEWANIDIVKIILMLVEQEFVKKKV